jgi:2-oxoglutarate ferredoxin oxidoreductase subunit gamma
MEAALKGKEKFFSLNQKGIERGFSFIREGK